MAQAAKPAMARDYPPLRGGKLLFLTAAIATAAFMEILDMTIVNVSVPAISGSLGASNSEGTWVVSSYMLTAAVMQPLTGWISRRFGEVRTFVSSVCRAAYPGTGIGTHDVGGAGHIAAQLSARAARHGDRPL
jgi:MFS family permease